MSDLETTKMKRPTYDVRLRPVLAFAISALLFGLIVVGGVYARFDWLFPAHLRVMNDATTLRAAPAAAGNWMFPKARTLEITDEGHDVEITGLEARNAAGEIVADGEIVLVTNLSSHHDVYLMNWDDRSNIDDRIKVIDEARSVLPPYSTQVLIRMYHAWVVGYWETLH